MADFDLTGVEKVEVTAGRCIDYHKERNDGGGAVQVVATLTGDMTDGTTRKVAIAVGPGWLRDHGCGDVPCDECDGTGHDECPKCGGAGTVLNPQKALEDNIFDKLSDPPQSERDKVTNFLKANMTRKELKELFEK